RYGFESGVSTHVDRLATIKAIFEATGHIIDPHTADGVKVARQFVEPGVPMLVLETALPAKFSETIEEAIGQPAVAPALLADLESLPQRVTVLPCQAEAVRQYIETHAAT
ncbi:MAG: threonine synthase, partial [Burkholderiaceae bacterium]